MENQESTKWLRDGHTIYSLMHAGFRKCEAEEVRATGGSEATNGQ